MFQIRVFYGGGHSAALRANGLDFSAGIDTAFPSISPMLPRDELTGRAPPAAPR